MDTNGCPGPGTKGNAVLAVDFGGTKTAVALVDPCGAVLVRRKLPAAQAGVQASAAQVRDAAREMLDESGCDWSQIVGAGAAVPGIFTSRTGMAWAPNLWGWEEVPLLSALRDAVPVPVRVDSDRSAYVLGEQWLGAARGLADVVFLAVGTGIGAGILSGGHLLRGSAGIAGAVGWFALSPAKRAEYIQTGCFEAEAAGPAVARRAGCPDAVEVVRRARNGDSAAESVLVETAGWLAMGIANIVSLLNPEMIVLGGGLMQAGELLLDPIRRELAQWAQPIAARQVRIELTRLGEDAGLLGAARLALEECA